MENLVNLYKNLSYHCYDVHISPSEEVIFDAWPGAIIRNNLLFAAEQILMPKIACSLRNHIDAFPLKADHPLYDELKEGFPKGYTLTNFSFNGTSIPCTEMKKNIPSNPYMVIRKGAPFSFSLLLIGNFNDYRFYFFEAIRQMCERGIGKPITPFTLTDIKENSLSPVTLSDFIENIPLSEDTPDASSLITIRFLTPAILYRLRNKKNTQLSYQDKTNRFPSFYQLIRSSLFRVQKLYALYENPSEKDASLFDETCLENYLEKAGHPLLKSANIQHISLPNSQKKGMKNELPLAGYIGEQTYEGYFQQYVPLLKFMSVLGVGNETVYGMGKFEAK